MAAIDHNDQHSENDSTLVEHSVDELAKSLAEGKLSRRRALRMLGAVVVGGTLASFPGMAWAAKLTCQGGATKCGKNCCPDASFVCSRGKCACPGGTTNCLGTCVNPATFQTDVQNCGACGNACSGGKTCQGGVCACPSGQEFCPGQNACVPSCPFESGQHINATTCQCECSPGYVFCQGVCFNPETYCAQLNNGMVFNVDTCQCECPNGGFLCGPSSGPRHCVTPCPPGEAMDFNTCQCAPLGCCECDFPPCVDCISAYCDHGKIESECCAHCRAGGGQCTFTAGSGICSPEGHCVS